MALSRSLIPTRLRCRDLLPVIVRGREIRYEGTPRVERIVNEKNKVMEEKEGRGVQFRISDGRGRSGAADFTFYPRVLIPLMFENKRETFYFLFVAT